jgi:ribosomal protein L37AE/L43A
MGVLGRVRRLVSGDSASEAGGADPAEAEEPSHVCESCGETYFTDPNAEIPECRACGGVRVARA